MRLYEYRCGCGKTAIGSGPPLCECGEVMIRDWTTNIAFHGKGFYVNDARPQQ